MKVVAKEPYADGMIRFLPIKEICTDVHIQDGVAVISMVHQYYNPDKLNKIADGEEAKVGDGGAKPLEVCFLFPKQKNSIISQMTIKFGETVVYTKIMEKEKAQKKYDDAIAGGKAAVLLKEETENEYHSLNVGNILPGQIATIEIQVLQPL